MGRWLNPESIKIYARMTKQEYASWIDKLMSVRRIDTARTTSLPIMDAANAVAAWNEHLSLEQNLDVPSWKEQSPSQSLPAPSVLKPGDRVSVYWTELREWYDGTYTSSRIEQADGGGLQRASRVLYDAAAAWSQQAYWHCLDDECWHRIAGDV